MNKAVSVLAVVAILGVSFYAGQKSFGFSVEYEHQDVIDAVKSCGARSFIGSCKRCKTCDNFNYAAGGCSYFKDTFCTLCTPIKHCDQKQTWCTTKSDQKCQRCDPGYFGPRCAKCSECSDTEYVAVECRSNKGKHSDTVCKPCTQCNSKNEYLTKTCIVKGNGVTVVPGAGKNLKDSTCAKCKVCKDGFQYTNVRCESPGDLKQSPAQAVQKIKFKNGRRRFPKNTQCATCTGCMHWRHPTWRKTRGRQQLYSTEECKNPLNKKTGFYTEKLHAKCEVCSKCKSNEFISKPCAAGIPHKRFMCRYRGRQRQCKTRLSKVTGLPIVLKGQLQDKTPADAKLGSDTECQKCTKRKKGEWTVFPCNSQHTSDAVHQKCSKCTGGEYEFAKCTGFSDTICPSCPSAREKLYANNANFKSGLMYCSVSPVTGLPHTFCTSTTNKIGVVVPRSTKCGRWDTTGVATKFTWPDGSRHTLPYDQDHCLPDTRGDSPKYAKCGKWVSNCQKGFFGQSCCYHKHPYSCGTETSRQRSARRMKFPKKGRTLNDLAEFCMSICDEFPDCLAVEIQDGGDFSDPAKNGNVVNNKLYEQTCYFKSAFSQDQKFRWKSQYRDDQDILREGDPALDCYSNTCRQNIFMTAGAKVKVINYKPKESKTFLQVLDEKTVAYCTKFCTEKHFKGKGVIGSKYNQCKSKCRTTWNKIGKTEGVEKCLGTAKKPGKCFKFNSADKKAKCMGKCQIDWINGAKRSAVYNLSAVPSSVMAIWKIFKNWIQGTASTGREVH